MTLSSDDFRNTLRMFAAGVTLVTTRTERGTHGLTVSAFSSVSADPPLIAVFIDHRTVMHGLLRDGAAPFAVNILAAGQDELSNHFAFAPEERRFDLGRWSTATTGAPVLEDALAWLDCTVHARHEAGSHSIYLGAVQETRVLRSEAAPLIYWNRGYRKLAGS